MVCKGGRRKEESFIATWVSVVAHPQRRTKEVSFVASWVSVPVGSPTPSLTYPPPHARGVHTADGGVLYGTIHTIKYAYNRAQFMLAE